MPLDRGLRWTLLGCGLGLALATFGAAWGVRAAESESVSAWENDLRVIAEDRRLWVESWLESTQGAVRVAAAYPTVVWLTSGRPADGAPSPSDLPPEAYLTHLFDSLCHESGFISAILVDRTGSILAVGGNPSPADRDPARLVALGGRDIPSLEIDADLEGCAVRFVEPVRSRNGKDLLGALVVREDVRRHLAQALAWRGRASHSEETFLVERKAGAVRALSSSAPQLGFQPLEALAPGVGDLLQRLATGSGPKAASSAQAATARIAAFSPVSGLPWGIASTLSRDEAVEGQQTQVVARVAAAALGMIAALLGGFAFRERRRGLREAEAHARDARLVSAIEHTRDVALFVREDGTIVEALGAAERIYRAPAGSLVGRRLEDVRAPESRVAEGESAVDPLEGTLSEETHLRADGSPAPVEVSTSPVTGTDGDRWYLALVRDAGERRRAEEATRTLVRAVEQSPVSIVVTDRAGRIEYVNPRFTEVTGYAISEVLGKNPRILKSGATSPAIYADLWSTVCAGRVWHGEMVNRRKDGTHFTERASIAPVVDAHGEVTHFVAVKEDLTEWKELENRAKSAEARYLQAQKLEAIGQLAGGVAHDFNNLLCVILGYGQMVADDLGPDDPQKPRVAEIVRAGHAAEALTRQLLAFSRRQVLEPRVLDLNQVVHGVEKMLRRLIGEDVALVTELFEGPAVVRVDAGQMEQILMNLAVNARDAMPKGGTLTIRTSVEAAGEGGPPDEVEAAGGPWVVLSVADTGTGMDAATQARVFEPFFTTKPSGTGTGLGLATVYGIVRQSGGQVSFTSAPGQGTEFRIRLPRLALEAESDDRAPVDLQAYGGDETVLVAEDQEPVRQITRIWLERRGYRVLEAADGRIGIEMATAPGTRIDLLVTDVVMPNASGRDLAEAVRARDPDVPVIYVSGYTSDLIERRGILDPGVRLLDKPLSEAILLRNVREALDGSKKIGVRAEPKRP